MAPMLMIRSTYWINKTLFTMMLLLLTHSAIASEKFDKALIKIDNHFTQSTKAGFSGALLIAHEGEIVLSKGYGLADKENETPVTPNTVFDIGSVTKQFTGAAILKLVEKGKVSLDDKLSKYFDNLPGDKENISIHQLLTHTSGIQALPDKGDFDLVETELFFQRLFAQPLAFKPGKRHRYSNAGYTVLGRIIELTSGKPYEQFLHQDLFTPLGMTQTGYLLPDWKASPIAKGYRYGVLGEGSMLARYQQAGEVSWVLKGNGGLQSTLPDLHRWLNALATNQILPKNLMTKFTTPYVKEDASGRSHYAYGWAIFTTSRKTKLVTHNGGNNIFFADLWWLPEEKIQIILLSNTSSNQAMSLAAEVEMILHDPSYAPRAFALPDVAQLLEFAQQFTGSQTQFAKQLSSRFKPITKHPRLLNQLGNYYRRQGDLATALKLFEANVTLHEKDGNAWDSLGLAYYQQANYNAAKQAFEKALKYQTKRDCYWCEDSKHYLNLIAEKGF